MTTRADHHSAGCACWRFNAALGHSGHCCFVRDDRNRRVNGGWRTDEEVCHIPASSR